MMKNKMYLSEVAQFLPGYPFRGKIEADQEGNASVVQMRNVSPVEGIDWGSLMPVNVGQRKHPLWLKHDDIIFAARGANNYAIHVENPISSAVLSPHFFLIRMNPNAGLLPEFLAWQMNQAPARKYFASSSEGSLTVSIRRAVLEALPISIPSIQQQQKVIRFIRCWKQQQKAFCALEDNNEKLMAGIANQVLNKASEE